MYLLRFTCRSLLNKRFTHCRKCMEEFPVGHRPAIVIFDLDFTVWPYWADCHLDPPFSEANGIVKDSKRETVELYSDTIKIFEFLKHHSVPMAIASKSPETRMYHGLMKLLDIHKYFVQFEIYCKNKQNHMRAIHTGQKVDFQDMIFFDDEYNNIRSTRELGVTAVHCPNRRGLTWEIFMSALKAHDVKHSQPSLHR